MMSNNKKSRRGEVVVAVQSLEGRQLMSAGDPTSTFVTLVASPGNSLTAGTQVTLTAQVGNDGADPTAAVPTGSVFFGVNGTGLGTVSVDANGVATFSTSTLPSGLDVVFAVYYGDATHVGSSADELPLTVNDGGGGSTDNGGGDSGGGDSGTDGKIGTWLELDSDSDEISRGDSVTLTATLSTDDDGDATPGGTVSFYAGSKLLGQASLGDDGTASLDVSTLAVGDTDVTAKYSGDATYDVSNADPITITVDPADAELDVPQVADSYAFGTRATFSAALSADGGGAFGGVIALVNDDDGSTLATAKVSSKGAVRFSLGGLAPGDHEMHMEYSGDAGHSDTISDEFVVHVGLAPTTASVSASGVGNGSATLRANLASRYKSDFTGTVDFYDGSTLVGSADLDDGDPVITVGGVGPGVHAFTARYSGDEDFAASTSLAKKVAVRKSSVTPTVSVPAATAGQPTTISASLASPTPFSGATVRFVDGSTLLGTATADENGNVALDVTFATSGRHTVRAIFAGDTAHLGATGLARVNVGA